jgi:adenosylmethionine-8-amino-7-oxononanoate aminotransferase
MATAHGNTGVTKSGAASNRGMVERTLAAVWHPCTQMKAHESFPPLPVVRGEGAWLIDADGRRYLDAISSWWVNLFGHSNARINAALRDQLDRLEHVILAGFTHEPVIELSERLGALTGQRLGHCFYASDGSSAVEIALKMSMHYWRNCGQHRKTGFVTVAGGYHGETLGALSVSDVALFRDAYAPLLRESSTVPSPDWRNAEPGETAGDVAVRAAAQLEQHLAANAGNVAAVIVEPLVQCANRMAMYDAEYLRLARAACDRHGVHLIADEIAVGFGRTGTFFAHEAAGITPDFMTLSKGITGGYLPLSVVMCRDEIYQAFYSDEFTRGFLHSHSYTGNALACSAALAVLDLFEQRDVLAANRDRARSILDAAQPLSAHPRVSHLRQTGMITAFDVDTDDPAFSRRYHLAALEHGVLLRPIGNTVYFMPPYVLGDAHVEQLVDGARQALESALA